MSTPPSSLKQDWLHTPFVRVALPFINGGLAGMTATAIIQPIDMVKVRLQLAGSAADSVATGGAMAVTRPTPFSIAREIVAAGKVLDLYTGLSAGLLRQAVYTTARLGFFDTFMNALTARAAANNTSDASKAGIGFGERALAGLAAGGLAAMVGNPADLALIRMQSDGLKPAGERANYKGVFDALLRISRNEGITALWAGCTPTIVRAMALNFGQLAFFSEAKTRLKQLAESQASKSVEPSSMTPKERRLHELNRTRARYGLPEKGSWLASPQTQTLAASAIAGFFASFFSLPFDFVKTRLQKQTKRSDGSLPYKSMFDCFRKVARDEGLLRFYRGFGTYYVRIAPHAMVTLIVADYLGWITK